MNLFKDKVAIITGGGSGIGQSIGQKLADRGAVVILADRDIDLARQTADAIEQEGGRAKPYYVDVIDRAAMQDLVNETVQEHGRINYMFNNAGIGIVGEARDFAYEDWKNVIDVNLYGVIHGVHAVLPVMTRQKNGHIINTASLAGLTPVPFSVSYVASKFGVVGLSHALRAEMAHLGIKVSVVCPGLTDTPILQTSKVIKHDRDALMKWMPQPQAITAERMAREVLRGIRKNKATIIAPISMWFAWFFYRLYPGPVLTHMQRLVKKTIGTHSE